LRAATTKVEGRRSRAGQGRALVWTTRPAQSREPRRDTRLCQTRRRRRWPRPDGLPSASPRGGGTGARPGLFGHGGADADRVPPTPGHVYFAKTAPSGRRGRSATRTRAVTEEPGGDGAEHRRGRRRPNPKWRPISTAPTPVHDRAFAAAALHVESICAPGLSFAMLMFRHALLLQGNALLLQELLLSALLLPRPCLPVRRWNTLCICACCHVFLIVVEVCCRSRTPGMCIAGIEGSDGSSRRRQTRRPAPEASAQRGPGTSRRPPSLL
jgi:hypothetical protein